MSKSFLHPAVKAAKLYRGTQVAERLQPFLNEQKKGLFKEETTRLNWFKYTVAINICDLEDLLFYVQNK